MKKQFLILFAFVAITISGFAQPVPQIVLTKPTRIGTFGDSFWRGAQANGGVGYRMNWILGSYFINKYPKLFVAYIDHSRSGDNNGGFVQRLSKFGMIDFGNATPGTNGLFFMPASGNFANSNSIFTNMVIGGSFPTSNYDNAGNLTNDWPFSATSPQTNYSLIMSSDIPYNDGRDVSVYSDGAKNAALQIGMPYVNLYALLNGYIQSYPAHSNLYISPIYDHPGNEITGAAGMMMLFYPTNNYGLGADTNIWTLKINAATMSIASTQACVVTGLSGGATTNISFTLQTDCMGPSYFWPDGVNTNDMRGMWTLVPGLGNLVHEDMQISGLRSGIWRVTWDGTNSYYRTSDQLSAGDNTYTNLNTSLAYQRMTVLYGFCVLHDVLFTDAATDAHTSDNRFMENEESFGGGIWATNTFGVSGYVNETRFLDDGNMTQYNVIHASAQQVPHAITLSYVGPAITFSDWRK